MRIVRTTPRRYLPLAKRDRWGLDSIAVAQMRALSKSFKAIAPLLREKLERRPDFRRKAKAVVALYAAKAMDILSAEVSDEIPTTRRSKVRTTVHDFDRDTFSERFRFRSPEDIIRLIHALQIPRIVRTAQNYKFSAQEVVLITLMRLASPLRWTTVQDAFKSRPRWQLQRAFYWFLDFMIKNWGYLILNNREYWLPFLSVSCESIRQKLTELPNASYRETFPPATPEGGFRVFGFIDNTMVAMCRPGGGPITGGEQAPRVPKDVQQAWWTGWKKLHGLKWQTVVMANGMDFDVWGPVSVRHNDNFTLGCSDIEAKLHQLQLNEDIKYKQLNGVTRI